MPTRTFLSAACMALLLADGVPAFTFVAPNARSTSTSLKMAVIEPGGDRRSFLSSVAATTAAAVAGASTSSIGQPVEPAYALGGKLNKLNAKLQGYGLPLITNVPNGFSPLVELYGKGKNRDPLLVQFNHPVDWVVVLPNNDVNGEDGTIQAGEYAKGDTATLFVYTDPGKVEDIASQSKDFFQNAVIKAISQKGDNIYQNFKITKIAPTKGEYKDQTYVLVDFKYELLTGAGFEVDRTGVASITSVGNAVEVLWTASTRQRFKKTESALRDIAGSFRCYADGLNLAAELKEYNFD